MSARPQAEGEREVRQFTVGADDDGVRLDRWFKRHLPQVGFGTVSKWARTGQLRVDGKRAKPEDRLAAGQVLRVPPGGDTAPKKREPRPLTDEQRAAAEAMLIARTDSALVLNKPPGLATQGGTKTTAHVDGLLDALQFEAEGRPKLVHRLDKDTSGALLVARTARAARWNYGASKSPSTIRARRWSAATGWRWCPRTGAARAYCCPRASART